MFLFLLLNKISFSQENNIAFHKPVIATSEAGIFPAANMVDGKISRTSKWEAANGKAPHIVEIDLRKYYSITELRVHSGIMDAEKKPSEMTQAAGFWSVKNFKMQYWDDANWSDLPQSEVHENRLTTAIFKYSPAITTFKIRLVSDDGEPINIMEIEAFGAEAANMPIPPTVSSTIKTQGVSTAPQSAIITVSDKVVGKTMKYVGYNQGYYFPGSNVSGWVEYSNVNSFRIWTSLNSFVPQTAVQGDKTISSVEEFDKRKAELRKSPEKNNYIKWNSLLPLYDKPDSSSTNAMVFNYALTELKRLKVDVVLQMGSTDFEDSWENKWKQWQRYYALAYYAAKKGSVAMFALQNEPNHRNSGPMKLDQWIMAMQIVSDAIHCAVEDVNKKYGKSLTPKFVGPVTAGNNPEWWAAVGKNIRTDYHGKTLNKDLLQIFSTHSYNSPAVGYESRIKNINEIIQANHPAGKTLPVAYTEIGRWMNAYLIDKEETMDAPSLFTEWAGIYANNMKNGGYGMWAFKFANTASGPYPRGIKSGHHFIWQGKRIVEDAYKNIAFGKTVATSNAASATTLITDGNKTDASTWISDSTTIEKWIELDLGKINDIGSAVIYTGDASGVYTSPERIKNFKLRYAEGSSWKDIPGAEEKDNKYAQVFQVFKQHVSTNKIRFVTNDKGSVKVREIKLFAKDDGPSGEASYNVSGIQRTGQVVRLFAKGFKNERPLLETRSTVNDSGLDSYTSYDEQSGNYYMWLVQRGLFDYNLKLDLKDLDIASGTPITAETVNPSYCGEVTELILFPANKNVDLTVSAQSVVLLTIPKNKLAKKSLIASADATVFHGKGASALNGSQKELIVQLDAAKPEKNHVSYIWFDLSKLSSASAQRILLKVNGYTDKTNAPFRLHVYGISTQKWDQQKLAWNNAPLLDSKEALIKEVGQKAFVAGELAFNTKHQDHILDVTDMVKKHAGKGITFVFIRETRQLGDDEDKDKKVMISSLESNNKPELIFWMTK
ncbi:MAG: discoidin domain-containing protein [Chitinophagaceae bacterium]